MIFTSSVPKKPVDITGIVKEMMAYKERHHYEW